MRLILILLLSVSAHATTCPEGENQVQCMLAEFDQPKAQPRNLEECRKDVTIHCLQNPDGSFDYEMLELGRKQAEEWKVNYGK